MVSPKKIFRRQSSKLTKIVDDSSEKENDEYMLIEQPVDNSRQNLVGSSEEDGLKKTGVVKSKNVLSDSISSSSSETISNIVAGCRPKIKTKPIIIPKSDSKDIKNEEEEFDDIKPLQSRYSYRNDPNIQADRLSTTLPRNTSIRVSFESKYKPGMIYGIM